jgi:hypothetical protein
MIRSFRLRPLLMFASVAGASVVVGLLFISAALLASFSFQPIKAVSVVFPAIALLWLALGAFLMMLGLVGEVVIREQWSGGPDTLPLVREGEA